MKNTLTSIAFCAAVTLVSGQSWAQSQSSSTSQGSQNSSLQQANAQEFFRSSDVVGKSTQDSKGNKVGSIKDIAFNQQGEIFALVDVGSGKWAAVPWQVIQPATAKGSGNVTLNATQQQLKAGPAVTKDQWGSLNNPQFVQGCYTYYNLQPPTTATGGASSPGSATQDQGQSSSSSDQSQMQTNQTSGAQSQTGGASSPGGTSSGTSDQSQMQTNQTSGAQSQTSTNESQGLTNQSGTSTNQSSSSNSPPSSSQSQ